MESRIYTYDTRHWRFNGCVQNILGVTDLKTIHTLVPYTEIFDRAHDQSSIWHKKFYSNNAEFLKLYTEFVKTEIKKLFPGEKYLVYQLIPTFRVQLKNNVSVGEFHRDRDYNHATNQINFYLPFVDTNEFNSIWIESKDGLEDYHPYVLKYGEMLQFDGSNLKHGNKINTSEESRVSVDFRVIPFSEYKESNNVSINTKMPLKIGGYFGKI